MLLFSDGFDQYNIYDIGKKWGFFSWGAVVPKIVSGIDPVGNKPYATKNGRALYSGNGPVALNTGFRPSRTVYAGFAVRTRSLLKLTIDFCTKVQIDRGDGRGQSYGNPYFGSAPGAISTLTLTLNQWNVGISQTFSGATTRVGSINTTMNMWSGDYHYIQVGMTLNGNASAQPQAWMEVRVGGRLVNRFLAQNILTSLPDETAPYSYINGLGIHTGGAPSDASFGTGTTIDDFYICNDEGDVNNTFLGNVKVRRALPIADGSENDATPVGGVTGYRYQYVDEDFISFAQTLPYPQPTPEQDPLFIPWEKGVDDYLILASEGDRQMLRFTNVDFAGSSPTIHGAVLHALARGQYRNAVGSTALKGIKKTGAEPIAEANPTDTPLNYSPTALATGGWDTYPMVFENDEVVAPGQPYQIWNPTALNGSEFGIELARCTIDPAMYDQNLVRFNLVFEQTISEFLGFYDFTHRFFDEMNAETLTWADTEPTYQYTWKFIDSLYWGDELVVTRSFDKRIKEEIKFEEIIPWIYLFAQGQIAFTDEIFIQWHNLVEESVDAADWADGFWEELFTDGIDFSDATAAHYIERLDEMFGLEEPYLWDGHEDVEETLEINVTYVWDNHELMEEYLYPDDLISHGIGLDIEEELALAEDHHDGNWTELFPDSANMADSVLTQHWRYVWFMGIIIESLNIAPIEQAGSDGDKTGTYEWGY
jgi:hypothetical protein